MSAFTRRSFIWNSRCRSRGGHIPLTQKRERASTRREDCKIPLTHHGCETEK